MVKNDGLTKPEAMKTLNLTASSTLLWSKADHALDDLSNEQRMALTQLRTVVDSDPDTWSCREMRDGLGTFNLDDYMLLRFLVARDLDQKKTQKFLLEHLEWRDKIMPGLISKKELPNVYDSGNMKFMGKTKQGVNVMLSDSSKFEPGIMDIEEFINYFVFQSERSIRLMDPSRSSQHIIVFDLAGWSLSKHGGMKPTKMTKAMIDIAQSQYPERLLKAVIINSPWVFKGFWNIIYPFIDNKTRMKVEFASANFLVEKGWMDPEDLPPCYGGTMEGGIPIHPAIEDI